MDYYTPLRQLLEFKTGMRVDINGNTIDHAPLVVRFDELRRFQKVHAKSDASSSHGRDAAEIIKDKIRARRLG